MDERAQKTAGRAGRRAEKADKESAVLAKIAAMPETYRAMGERLHAIIIASAPALSPTTWYGMPAYAKAGRVICFFRVDKYVTFGFTEDANLFDEGDAMQPSSYLLRELTADAEAAIAALVRRAVR